MRPTALAAASIVLGALPIGMAYAEHPLAGDWWRRAGALVQSLAGPAWAADPEIIAPPGNIDPNMALVPPRQGTMRIIVPPAGVGRRP